MEQQAKTSRSKLAMICIMIAAFYALHVTLDAKKLLIVGVIALLSLLLVVRNRNSGLRFDKSFITIELAVLLLSGSRFYDYWIIARKVGRIAARLSLKPRSLLLLLGAFCVILSFYGINILLSRLAMLRPIEKATVWLNKHPAAKNGALVFLLINLQLLQLQRSSLHDRGFLLRIDYQYLLANLAVILTIYFFLRLLLRSGKRAMYSVSLLATLYSIVNFYVILYHGGPLYPSEFAQARTAFNVFSSYSIVIGSQIVDIIALFFAELYLTEKMYAGEKQNDLKITLLMFVSGALSFLLLFSPMALHDRYPWSWKFDISVDGFIHSAASNLTKMLHPIRSPGGYDRAQIVLPEISSPMIPEKKPDIIVIINETFCDLSVFSDVKTDVDYMDDFFGIENASYGYSFSPEIGGGTNNSEYEVLTSDSMALLNSYAPFDYLELNDKNSTHVSYLKSLGYETYAIHAMTGANYNRGVAYPALGFDYVFLGENPICDARRYGNRQELDRDEYTALLPLLEDRPEQPKFLYLLTYQNHGGYEQNDASLDRIHTTVDYGDLTDDINEYLTSVSMSAEAIHEFIDYLAARERPVILCMVGDHAPSFIQQLNGNCDRSAEEESLWQRAVPYIIWANFDYRKEALTEYTSMTDLVPMMLSAADMPLTPFYQQILDLHELLPVRTPHGICLDAQGNILHYENGDYPNEALRQYLFMEYNELLQGEDYLPELFRIPAK